MGDAAEEQKSRYLQTTALKEKALSLTQVEKLTDHNQFSKLEEQLKRQEHEYNWPKFILNYALAVPDDANLTERDKLCINNAYSLIVDKCGGHEDVGGLLNQESVDIGDAREAWKAVKGYFIKATISGSDRASEAFYTATQANTGTTITGWAVKVQKLAKTLGETGSVKPDDRAQVLRLLKGVLPEFKPIVTYLKADNTTTFSEARRQLLDFAADNGIGHLTAASGKGAHHNTYQLDGQGPCRFWTRHQCRWPDCKFNHTGPGGLHPAVAANGGKYITMKQMRDWEAANGRGQRRQPAGAQVNLAQADPPAAPKRPDPAAAVAHVHTAQAAHTTAAAAAHVYQAQIPAQSSWTQLPPQKEAREPTCYICMGCDHDTIACPSSRHHGSFVIEDEDNNKPAGKCAGAIGVVRALLVAVLAIFPLLLSTSADIANIAHPALTQNALPMAGILGLLLYMACGAKATMVTLAPLHLHSCDMGNTSALHDSIWVKARTAKVRADSYGCAFEGGRCREGLEWCSDSGTNRTVTNDISDFVPGSVKRNSTTVKVGGGETVAPCYGDVIIRNTLDNSTILCKDVLYLPKCAKKLLPCSPFVRKGCSYTLIDNKAFLKNSAGNIILEGIEVGGLYYFHSTTVRRKGKPAVLPANHQNKTPTSYFGLPSKGAVSAATSDFAQRLLETHWAYGHIHMDKLRKMLGLKKGDNPECAACTIAKSRTQKLKQAYIRSTRQNHRILIDLGFTKNREYTFQLYLDDYTSVSYLDVLAAKDDSFPKWLDLKNHLEKRDWPLKFAFIRTDSEPIYTDVKWEQHCKAEGIVHEFSSRYRHDQNGRIESAMEAVGVPYRTMMLQGNAPNHLIPKVLKHANLIRNHSPTKANNGWTPAERQAGRRLPMNKRLLKGPLLCLCYAHIYKLEGARSKHGPRGVACVYIGYDAINNAYEVMEWETGETYFTADLTFHPNTFPFRENPHRDPRFLNVYDASAPHRLTPASAPAEQRQSARQMAYRQSSGVELSDIPDVDVPPGSYAVSAGYKFDVDNFTFSPPCDIVVLHTYGPDPDNWKEAMQSVHAPKWIEAMLKEKNSFREHNVLTIVPRSEAAGARVFKPRVVLKIKMLPSTPDHPQGKLDKFKYRLTIAAFTRMLIQGIDYAEKHASTVRWQALLVLLALAAHNDFDIVLFDISTFFLYGEVEEDKPMYMEQPPHWEEEPDKPRADYICRCNKSLYGMPNAANRAQQKLQAALAGGDFRSAVADDCVHVLDKRDKDTPFNAGTYAALGSHVDDLTVVGTPDGLKATEDVLSSNFKITKSVNPRVITGVQIERNRKERTIKLHMADYINNLLKDYEMHDCKPADTPMDPGTAKALMQLPIDQPDPVYVKKFQKFVGVLMWLCRIRLDILFCVNLLARMLQCATKQHYELAINRPLRYLRGTTSMGIVLVGGKWILEGFGDADLAGDLRTARSTSGYLLRIGDGGAICASSKLERKLSTSTGQAETYALVSLVKEVVWVRLLAWDLGFPFVGPTPVFTDNDGVLKQATKSINHATAKHYG